MHQTGEELYFIGFKCPDILTDAAVSEKKRVKLVMSSTLTLTETRRVQNRLVFKVAKHFVDVELELHNILIIYGFGLDCILGLDKWGNRENTMQPEIFAGNYNNVTGSGKRDIFTHIFKIELLALQGRVNSQL